MNTVLPGPFKSPHPYAWRLGYYDGMFGFDDNPFDDLNPRNHRSMADYQRYRVGNNQARDDRRCYRKPKIQPAYNA